MIRHVMAASAYENGFEKIEEEARGSETDWRRAEGYRQKAMENNSNST